MNWLKTLAAGSCIVLALGAFLPIARADEENQQMKLTFSAPVELPGHILPAGTYWFVLADSQSTRNLMQVFSEDRSTLYATLITVTAYRMGPTDQPEIRFAERPHGAPDAIVKLFYPGFQFGHEFIYRRRLEQELRHDAKLDVLSRPINVHYPGSATPHS